MRKEFFYSVDAADWKCTLSGVGSVATRTLEWEVKIHQHRLN